MRRRRRVLTVCQKQHRSLWRFGWAVVAILLLASQSHADTTTWDVTASCTSQCFDPANINAVLVTTPEIGNPQSDPVNVVTSLTGTFDGQPMTLISLSDFAGCECDELLQSFPLNVSFEAEGAQWDMWWDGTVHISTVTSFADLIQPMNWSAVDPVQTPEPLTIFLIFVVVVLYIMWRRFA